MNGRDREALSDILGVLDRALGFPIANLQTLEETDYLQDALIRCLEVIGEATKRLSQDFRDRHPEVPWRAMAGMRDLLIHAYDRVDLEEVWEAHRQFRGLREQIAAMVDPPRAELALACRGSAFEHLGHGVLRGDPSWVVDAPFFWPAADADRPPGLSGAGRTANQRRDLSQRRHGPRGTSAPLTSIDPAIDGRDCAIGCFLLTGLTSNCRSLQPSSPG